MKIASKAALRKKGPTKQGRRDRVYSDYKRHKTSCITQTFFFCLSDFGKMLVTDALIFIPLVTNERISKGTVILEDEYWSKEIVGHYPHGKI